MELISGWLPCDEILEELDAFVQLLRDTEISHHLSILRHCRLVEQRRDGKHNFYDLTDEGQELADLIAPLFHGALALEDER